MHIFHTKSSKIRISFRFILQLFIISAETWTAAVVAAVVAVHPVLRSVKAANAWREREILECSAL